MAVSSTELSDGEFFTQLGMLIIQGRKWDGFRRCRSRGLHCPTVRNSTPPHHQCSASNAECQSALSFRHAIHTIWQRGAAVAIDVLLLPECNHHEPSVLLEKWCISRTDEVSSMPKLSLMQAIDSTIHFSQLSSWWASTNGCQPNNVEYRVYESKSMDDASTFLESPVRHHFSDSNGVKVQLQYLPRQRNIPNLFCFRCSASCVAGQHAENIQMSSPSRGRSFTHRGHRRGSRHSSASSDSLSPSIARLDASPYGSPLLPSRLRRGISSSSSSRGSSRTASPCMSCSPSERNMVVAFEASRHVEEDVENFSKGQSADLRLQNDSGFADQTKDSVTINQDEELANQLDSLSDSDLSDDYVIDGPVGSPGLVGSCLASPDDARVQMLQSTFAGWHCRRPTFDRLMADESGGRIRHSSLDSAVSNLERLELQNRRRLSRTSSDGLEFSNFAPETNDCKQTTEKDFFIRGVKKRHKMCNAEKVTMPDPLPHNTFFASFCTGSETLSRTPSENEPSTLFQPFDSSSTPSSRSPNEVFRYDFTSTPSSLGMSRMPHSLTLSLPCLSTRTFESSSKTTNKSSRDEAEKGCKEGLRRSLSLAERRNIKNENFLTLTLNTPTQKVARRPGEIYSQCSQSGSEPSMLQLRSTTSYVTPSQARLCELDDLKLDLVDEDPDAKDSDEEDETAESSSVLLRSPPSKLRILPNHCVDNNFAYNPPRQALHKPANNGGPARRLQFGKGAEKPPSSSPAPIRRNNSIRFEFDEDMPNLNQRSSRSMCRGKCMKKNAVVIHNHARAVPSRRLLGNFEESVIHNRLEVLGTVDGFNAQLGASGAFCPPKVKLPVPVQFFHISEDNAPSPYLGTMSLKGRECGKRGYHIPRKGTIQLTLFNPNKSVVKMFVILYDVSDMPPGQRTFLRHRIYSCPTLSPAVDHNANYIKTPIEEEDENKKSASCLRYLVNLWLESSKTNKVYIHGDIKILFSLASNEWDSGNTFELRTETEFPKNPRYSSKR